MPVLEVVMKEVELPPFRPRKVSRSDIFRRFCAGAEGGGLGTLFMLFDGVFVAQFRKQWTGWNALATGGLCY